MNKNKMKRKRNNYKIMKLLKNTIRFKNIYYN